MKKIVILRHMTVEAFCHVMANSDSRNGQAREWLYELVPGDTLPVCGRSGDTLVLPKGYAELPRNAWKWATPGVTSRQFTKAWQRAESVCEVAVLLGKSIRQVHAWERRCRQSGLRLKALPPV